MKKLLRMIVLVLACAGQEALADLTYISGPTRIDDGKAVVDLVVMNESAKPEAYVAPLSQRANVAGMVVRMEIANPQKVRDLAPGQFVRVTYFLDKMVPENSVITAITPLAVAATKDPTSQPEPTRKAAPRQTLAQAITDEHYQQESGLAEFLSYRLRPYEPVYFLIGPDRPNAKFQLSLKYQLFGHTGEQDSRGTLTPLSGIFLAYSQTSFWDLEGNSKPFFDNSYRPEAFYAFDGLDEHLLDGNNNRLLPDWMHVGFQTGLKHESNGLAGDNSRSLNIVYARAIMNFSNKDDYFLTVAPSIHGYVLGKDEGNDDIEKYRGYGDLKAIIGKRGGLQLAATTRIGSDWDKGSLQLDLSFPIRKLTNDNFDIYFHTQFFTGYGESLIRYNESDTSWRIGISMVR